MVMSFISNGAKLSTVFFSPVFLYDSCGFLFSSWPFLFFVKSVICYKAIFCNNLIVDCNLY